MSSHALSFTCLSRQVLNTHHSFSPVLRRFMPSERISSSRDRARSCCSAFPQTWRQGGARQKTHTHTHPQPSIERFLRCHTGQNRTGQDRKGRAAIHYYLSYVEHPRACRRCRWRRQSQRHKSKKNSATRNGLCPLPPPTPSPATTKSSKHGQARRHVWRRKHKPQTAVSNSEQPGQNLVEGDKVT